MVQVKISGNKKKAVNQLRIIDAFESIVPFQPVQFNDKDIQQICIADEHMVIIADNLVIYWEKATHSSIP